MIHRFQLPGRGPLAAAVLATHWLTAALWLAPAAAQTTDGAAANRMVTLQGIRSATVAPHGTGFAALSFTSRRDVGSRFSHRPDGSAVVGLGLGSATDGIGVQVSANITSLASSFADSGHLSLKFARRIATADTPTFVALSLDRLGGWGDARGVEPSATVAVTLFPMVALGAERYPVMLTVGAGSHVASDGTEPGVFFGAGIGLTPSFGASLAWTGETFSLGTAFRVKGWDDLRFSATLEDAFNQQDARRVTVSAVVLFDDLFGG